MTAGGWGGAEADETEEAPNGSLGDGHFIRIDEEKWHALMHSAPVKAAVAQRAIDIRDEANNMVAMDPRAVARLNPNGEPAYDYFLNDNESNTRPRARVHPSYTNSLGFIDDAQNSTLLKAMAAHPSDPIPDDAGVSEDIANMGQQERMTGPGFDEVD